MEQKEEKESQGLPTNEQTSSDNSEMHTMVDILAKSVQGMQGSLGNAYQALSNQLKQSMEMTQTMSSMMEMFLLGSLTINSRIERGERTKNPLLILTTENKSHFPIPGVSGRIRIGSDNDDEKRFEVSENSTLALLTSTLVNTIKKDKTSRKLDESIYSRAQNQGTPEQQNNTPLDVLGPGMKLIDIFELNLECFDDWVLLMEIGFNSPGTGKRLSKKHECCVYLVDQCDIEWINGESEQVNSDYSSMMVISELRQVLQVPMTEGVNTGKRFTITPSCGEPIIYGCIRDIQQQGKAAEIVLWSEDSSELSKNIIGRMQFELNILGAFEE